MSFLSHLQLQLSFHISSCKVRKLFVSGFALLSKIITGHFIILSTLLFVEGAGFFVSSLTFFGKIITGILFSTFFFVNFTSFLVSSFAFFGEIVTSHFLVLATFFFVDFASLLISSFTFFGEIITSHL